MGWKSKEKKKVCWLETPWTFTPWGAFLSLASLKYFSLHLSLGLRNANPFSFKEIAILVGLEELGRPLLGGLGPTLLRILFLGPTYRTCIMEIGAPMGRSIMVRTQLFSFGPTLSIEIFLTQFTPI